MLKPFQLVVLGTAFILPISLAAQNRQQQQQHTSGRQDTQTRTDQRSTSSQPYYDSTHRDWHQWNDGEEKAYRTYSEQHHKSGDFSSSKERDQQKYWNWRHKHSDSR
jgi:type II secretory pathway pseudopilin PulG